MRVNLHPTSKAGVKFRETWIAKTAQKHNEMAQGGEVFPWIHWVYVQNFGRSSLDATIYIALNSPCKLADISRYHLDTQKTGMTLLNLRDTKLIFNAFVFTQFLLDPSPCSGKAAVLWNRLTARCCLSFCLTQIHQGCQCWHYFPDSVHPNLPQFFTRLGGLQSGNTQVMVSLYLHSARRGFLPKCQSRCRVTGRTQLRWNM